MKRIIFILLLFPFYYGYANNLEYYINKPYILTASDVPDSKIEIAPVYVGDKVQLVYTVENLDDDEKEMAKVKLPSGEEGYLPFSYLQKNRPPESAIRKRTIIMLEPQTYYVNVTSLSLRTGPGTDYTMITTLSKGMPVEIKSLSNESETIQGLTGKWANVVTSGLEGWVFQPMLSPSQSSSSDSTEPWDHILTGVNKYVRPPYLRVRDEPGKLGAIIGSLRQGDSVQIVERLEWEETLNGFRSVWVKIRTNQGEGYVFGGFLSSRSGLHISSDDIDKPFIFPIDPDRSRISSKYGPRILRGKPNLHKGMDMAAQKGVPIYAARDGSVAAINSSRTGYGNLTVIQHDNGFVTYYAHQSKFLVKKGDHVKAGDTIGLVGSTGNSTGPHLHFEVRSGYGRDHYDPAEYTVLP